MPSWDEVMQTQSKVLNWYKEKLIKDGHPIKSAEKIVELSGYHGALEEYKKAFPSIWTGPYSAY